jgi:F-type H+-transporting ATPase subunit epsilon
MASLICEIVTPESLLFSEEVHFVSVPATEGEFGVLSKRAPIMSTLNLGEVVIKRDESATPVRFAVAGGYVEADGAKVVVLANRAADITTIDADATQASKSDAEKRLAALAEDDSHAAFLRDELAWYTLLETLLARH